MTTQTITGCDICCRAPITVRIADSSLAATSGVSGYSEDNGAASTIGFVATIGGVDVALRYDLANSPALMLSGSPATATYPQSGSLVVSTTATLGGETKTVRVTLTGATAEYVETSTRSFTRYGQTITWTQPIYRIVVDEDGYPTTGTLTAEVL